MRTLSRRGDPECRCGHVRAAHQHLRRGTECSLCPGTCPRFRLRLGSLWERRDEGGSSD